MKCLKVIVSLFVLLSSACVEKNYLQHENTTNGFEKLSLDCQVVFPKNDLCLSWKWGSKPTESDVGSIDFRIYKLSDKDEFPELVDLQNKVKVVLWMPGMGHGSSPVEVYKSDIGTYEGQRVFFVMPGLWEIKFQIFKGESLSDEVTVAVHI